jgi:hypothetical protein
VADGASFEDASQEVFRASAVRNVSMADVIAQVGPRVPAVGAAQTTFRAAVVVLSPARSPRPTWTSWTGAWSDSAGPGTTAPRCTTSGRRPAAGPFQVLDQVAGTAGRADFFAGDSSLRGGVRVAARDLSGDATVDLIVGSGQGEPGRVRVYQTATVLAGGPPAADQELAPFGDDPLIDGVFVG